MSSFSRACRAVLVAVALAAPLAACTSLTPVYQYGEADAERMAVQFGAPATRVEQIIYNELKLRFARGGPDSPRVNIAASQAGRSVPGVSEVVVTARVTVTDARGRTLTSVSRTASAAYTSSQQAFANQQATEDAANRAARQVADTLRLEILAALSK